jgi:hypothetical protein
MFEVSNILIVVIIIVTRILQYPSMCSRQLSEYFQSIISFNSLKSFLPDRYYYLHSTEGKSMALDV